MSHVDLTEKKTQKSSSKAITPDVSVVVYVDRNLENITQLYAYVANLLKEMGKTFEFILMDDGNTKNISVAMEGVQEFVINTRVVRLPRNVGPSTAMPVGFRIAKGNLILTLGPFLQVEPNDIRKMFQKIDEGFDFVNGWRINRSDSKLNQWHTRFYNRLVSKVSEIELHDTNCTLKLFKRSMIRDLVIYGDLYRFLPILAARQGFIVGEVPVKQRKELNTVGVYSLRTYVRRLMDLLSLFFISRYIMKPLRFFGPIGLSFFVAGLGINIYLVFIKFTQNVALAGRPLLLLGVLLIVVGLQVVSVGLIGELVLFFQAPNVKGYRVEKILE